MSEVVSVPEMVSETPVLVLLVGMNSNNKEPQRQMRVYLQKRNILRYSLSGQLSCRSLTKCLV